MLLNKKYAAAVCAVLLVLISSCGEQRTLNDETEQIVDFEDPAVVLKQAKAAAGENVEYAYKGVFSSDSAMQISAGTEIVTPEEWGIRFLLLKAGASKLEKTFESELLQGSFKESLIQKMKLGGLPYEVIYYNSLDYFMGSGGGEIFSYIVNYEDQKVYYAHLITEPEKPVSLYLSENIDNPAVKEFFMQNFQRDYPSLKLIPKDIKLEY